MPKWFWILISVVISSSVYFSIRYGLRPKPISLMSPDHFASLEELGVVTFRRLYQPIRSEKIIVLGYDQQLPDAVLEWQGLIKAVVESKVRIHKVYFWEGLNLPPYFEHFETHAFTAQELPEIKKELISSRRKNGLIVFLAPTEEATHLRKDSVTKRLEASVMGPVFSLSQMPLVMEPERLEKLSPSCTDLDVEDYAHRLECVTFKYARSQSRRKMDLSKIQGAIERYGLKEYLTFIHVPAAQ
jgi:hypothetical protein